MSLSSSTFSSWVPEPSISTGFFYVFIFLLLISLFCFLLFFGFFSNSCFFIFFHLLLFLPLCYFFLSLHLMCMFLNGKNISLHCFHCNIFCHFRHFFWCTIYFVF